MSTQTEIGRLSPVRKLIEVSWHEDLVHRPGVFLLRETKDGPVKYIGLSETDLRTLLVIHGEPFLKRQYRFYSYRHTRDDLQAYDLACKFFHQYRNTLDRCEHPASPDDPGVPGCPVHSCDF